MKLIKPSIIFSFLIFATTATTVNAAPKGSQGEVKYKNHSIAYSVFDSTFLNAKTLSSLGLISGDDYGIVNIVAIKDNKTIAIDILGAYSNLLQQKWPLDFVKVVEGDSIYYLANFKFDHLELLHFTVHSKPTFERYSKTTKFSHQLHKNGK